MIGWIITALVFLVAAHLMPGIAVKSFWAALFAAIILSIVNYLVKPFLFIITIPVNVLTLGLFTFVINALMILLVSWMVPGFEVNGFMSALALSLILTAVKFFLP